MRWLHHLTRGDAPIASPEGFVHCSYRDDLAETRRLHFTNISERDLRLIRIDPRRVADVRVEGPRNMPHVYGEIARDAWTVEDPASAPDVVTGTKFVVVGFARMTLLDLVGVLDPLGRIVTMDVDRDASIEVVSATDEPWSAFGATFSSVRTRPRLDAFEVLVVAGGPETRALENDPAIADWLRTFPENRMATSVCTGALLLGAAGRLRGKRATTHHASLDALARHGATAVPRTRVVRDGQLMTAGGVTSAMDLGLAIVEWLYGDEARARIAARMEYPSAPS
jgi:putative intracellular protease/amidase